MSSSSGSVRRDDLVKKVAKHEDRNKMDVRWEKRVWLGHMRDSNETIVGTDNGAIHA